MLRNLLAIIPVLLNKDSLESGVAIIDRKQFLMNCINFLKK